MFPEIFKKSFIDIFETLASDKVVNVRISLAHTIASHIKAKGMNKEKRCFLFEISWKS